MHAVAYGAFYCTCVNVVYYAKCATEAAYNEPSTNFIEVPYIKNVTKPLARLLEPLRIATILNIYLSNGM